MTKRSQPALWTAMALCDVVLDKCRGVMSGSVCRSKNDPSESLQMIESPLICGGTEIYA